MSHNEMHLQAACKRTLEARYSHIGACWHHSPNEGKRSSFTGHTLQQMGMRRGWPDLEIMYPAQGFHGLFVEFKFGKGRQSKEQRDIQAILEKNGYRYAVVTSHLEFLDLCHEYLGPESDPDLETLRRILSE